MANIFTNAINYLGATLKQTTVPDFLRDYQHASKIFVGQDFELVPKSGYLFHVFFDININLSSSFMKTSQALTDLGLMVKNTDLPRYNIENKLYNAYNRPNLIQTKIKYDNLTINFHDDSMNTVRNFWYDYFNYYYRDTDKSEQGYYLPYKYNADPLGSFGFTRRSESLENYLRAIRIYSLSRNSYSMYVLINPIIVNFKHGEHDYFNTASSNMTNSMTVAYENVLYSEGEVSDNDISGYATLGRYDTRPSPLNRLGVRKSIFGRRGLVDTAGSIIKDITNGNFISAIFKTATARQTFKGVNLGKAAVNEAKQLITIGATNAITGAITGQLQKAQPGGRVVASPLSLDGVVKNAYNGIARDTGTLALLGTATLLNSINTPKKYKQTPITQSNTTNLKNNYNPGFPRIPGAAATDSVPATLVTANERNKVALPTNQLNPDIRQTPSDIRYDINSIDRQIQASSVNSSYIEKQITQNLNELSTLNSQLTAARSTNASQTVITDLIAKIQSTTAVKDENQSKLTELNSEILSLRQQYNDSIKKLNLLK